MVEREHCNSPVSYPCGNHVHACHGDQRRWTNYSNRSYYGAALRKCDFPTDNQRFRICTSGYIISHRQRCGGKNSTKRHTSRSRTVDRDHSVVESPALVNERVPCQFTSPSGHASVCISTCSTKVTCHKTKQQRAPLYLGLAVDKRGKITQRLEREFTDPKFDYSSYAPSKHAGQLEQCDAFLKDVLRKMMESPGVPTDQLKATTGNWVPVFQNLFASVEGHFDFAQKLCIQTVYVMLPVTVSSIQTSLSNLAVSQPSRNLRVVWQLGTERVLQLNDFFEFAENEIQFTPERSSDSV
ncbi:hypothetical protein CLF_100495 [Clonorchis sinensis]|uniref:Uncharacterized protein n=1 Tax=Clonorchis sinensis TaxID=79923 RepID=G7Y3L3_CLOSI|nr:hypothetical protein CLF_100495 [Clonorchis sinensis]